MPPSISSNRKGKWVFPHVSSQKKWSLLWFGVILVHVEKCSTFFEYHILCLSLNCPPDPTVHRAEHLIPNVWKTQYFFPINSPKQQSSPKPGLFQITFLYQLQAWILPKLQRTLVENPWNLAQNARNLTKIGKIRLDNFEFLLIVNVQTLLMASRKPR